MRKTKPIVPPLSKNALRVLNVIMTIGFISAVPQILTTVMTTWREAEPIEYKYMFRGSEHSLYVDYTYYGLYKVIYDDKHVETWSQRVQNMRSKGSEGIQVGKHAESAGSLSLWTSACQEACRDAIIKRIEAYERVSFISLILLCGIVISCTLVILCIGWNILFTKSILISMGCFMLSFIINGGIGTYWYYETDLSWNLVTKAQQYPFPRCSYCFYIFIITTGIYALCFVCLLLLDLSNKSTQKKSHIDQMNMHNRNPMNAKAMYQPLFNDTNNMMMPRSSSYTNLMPFSKGMDNTFSNFMQYNKMGMNPMMGQGFLGFGNMPPNMGSNMPLNMGSNMHPSMQQNLNPNFFPQMSRQYSFSGATPSYQPDMQSFGNFPSTNMQDMSSMYFPQQFPGKSFDGMNNPFGSQTQYKF
ncbi:conserved Plasmodium protein, unknown function [Plasmodium malariae]|nr:conserved Plasmodium protein, unknown function [Plasmodium malariae]SCN45125.1 conserved Plasmodium protein, unknown function [Plasmodium malariae]